MTFLTRLLALMRMRDSTFFPEGKQPAVRRMQDWLPNLARGGRFWDDRSAK